MDCPKRGGAVAGLPDDPLVEILSRVPVKSLCRFKCVSRAWRDLIADPLHRRKLPKTLEGFFCSHPRRRYSEIGGSDSDGDGDGYGYGDGDAGDGDGGGGDKKVLACADFVDVGGRSVPVVDPSLSFLKELPGMEHSKILHSCNGLLLIRQAQTPYSPEALGYVVCNPATEESVAVPHSGWYSAPPEEDGEENYNREEMEHTFLIFDPLVSSHFKIVQFLQKVSIQNEVVLRTYSSETGVWIDRSGERRTLEEGDESRQLGSFGRVVSVLGSAFVNGMLHFIVYHIQKDQEAIVAVDWEGKTHRFINWPQSNDFHWSDPVFLGQSQGRVSLIGEHIEGESSDIIIWVLEDYDKEEWVMKRRVSSLQLFGRIKSFVHFDYIVAAIHPDRNLVFICHRGPELVSHNMDSEEVHALCTLKEHYECITPYVPYFSESSVLSNKH